MDDAGLHNTSCWATQYRVQDFITYGKSFCHAWQIHLPSVAKAFATSGKLQRTRPFMRIGQGARRIQQ
jgi:hypothetical protein